MDRVIACESGYNPTIQSRHRYKKDRPHEGVVAGQREQSFGLAQIHLPAHPNVSYEQATDPEFSVNFLAEKLSHDAGSHWTCYRELALR